MAAPPVAPPALDNTFGALLIGVIVSTALWGVMAVQTYEYYIDYPNDRTVLKILVGTVFCLDTLHHTFMCHSAYIYLIKSWQDPTILISIVWTLDSQVFVAGLVGFIVQGFFIWRIWILSHQNYVICGFIGALATAVLVLTTIYWAKGLSVHTFLELPKLMSLSRAVNATACATDLAISLALSYFLYSERSGMRRTNAIIKQLVVFSAVSGIWNSICTLSSLVSLSVWPETLVFIAFYIILVRLYSNSLLATLNARIRIREKAGGGMISVSSSQTNGVAGTFNRDHSAAARPVQIHMNYETQVDGQNKQGNGFELKAFDKV